MHVGRNAERKATFSRDIDHEPTRKGVGLDWSSNLEGNIALTVIDGARCVQGNGQD